MSRTEFSKQTKRDALSRAGNGNISTAKCEASGQMYGLEPSQRCNCPLSHGVEFDHVLAASNGGDASLGNCLAVCKRCHSWKTRNLDTPRAAKIVRQRDKDIGIKPRGRGWPKPPPGYDSWTRSMRKLEG